MKRARRDKSDARYLAARAIREQIIERLEGELEKLNSDLGITSIVFVAKVRTRVVISWNLEFEDKAKQ